MTDRIGFIGLGAMGQPMAANLARKGFDLTVFDISQDKVPPLRELGTKVAGSVAEVAETTDVAITMVPDGPDVEAVVLGPGGLAEAGREGQLVMDMSTVAPASTDRLAAALAARGIGFVDAPVGRLVTHAIAGESLFMVGGSDAAKEAGLPVFGGAAVLQSLAMAKATGDLADRDFSAILDAVCRLGGVKPPRLTD